MVDTGAQYSVINQRDGPMSEKSSWVQGATGTGDMDGLQAACELGGPPSDPFLSGDTLVSSALAGEEIYCLK